MAGYVSPDGKTAFGASSDGQTIFSRTLQELRNVVTTLNPSVNIVFRRVDAFVGSPSFNDLDLGQASVNRGLYTGKETNLAGAINLFPTAVQPEQEHALGGGEKHEDSEDQPPPPARFHILITDGVQSTNQQRTDISCTAGSDYVCVKRGIKALLENGWAGSILGMRSEFRGQVYSEIYRGQAIQYESKKGNPKTYRPFYLYIFSPDRLALDKLVEILKGKLRQVLGQDDAIREYALTSPYVEGFASAEISIPKQSADYLERTKAKEENPPRLTLRVDVDTENSGPQPFTVSVTIPWSSHAKDSGTPQELATLLRWELVPVSTAEATAAESSQHVRYPEVKLTGQQVDDRGQVALQATAQWPPGTGTPNWNAYRLEGRLNLEKQAPPWVQQWSTNLDTTPDAASKTLNLESALSGLWRNPTLEKQVVAEVYLRVGPQ